MSESDETKKPSTTIDSDEFARQFANFMRNSFAMTNQNSPPPPPPPEIVIDTKPLILGFKLNGENYPLWAVFIKTAISGRGMISYITSDPPPPPKTDPTFARWQQADHCVFTWLVQNLEPKLVNTVSQHEKAKDIWDSLAITYSSGGDAIQIYDLHRREITLKQRGEMLEDIWNTLQEIWISNDHKDPNPMETPKDIEVYNTKIQNQRLYQFLTAIDDKYEGTKKEILKIEPLPSVEQAYTIVRREDTRSQVLQPTAHNEEKKLTQELEPTTRGGSVENGVHQLWLEEAHKRDVL